MCFSTWPLGSGRTASHPASPFDRCRPVSTQARRSHVSQPCFEADEKTLSVHPVGGQPCEGVAIVDAGVRAPPVRQGVADAGRDASAQRRSVRDVPPRPEALAGVEDAEFAEQAHGEVGRGLVRVVASVDPHRAVLPHGLCEAPRQHVAERSRHAGSPVRVDAVPPEAEQGRHVVEVVREEAVPLPPALWILQVAQG